MTLSLPAPSALSQLTKNHRNLPFHPDFPSQIGFPSRLDRYLGPWAHSQLVFLDYVSYPSIKTRAFRAASYMLECQDVEFRF